MSDEYVTSPDQRKPEPLKIWRGVWVVVALSVAVMFFGNHTGHVEEVYLALTAGGIVVWLIVDAWMRKRGWK